MWDLIPMFWWATPKTGFFLTAQLQVSVKTKTQPENKPKTQGPSWPHPAETPEPNRSAPQPPASANPKRKPHPS